MTLATTMGKKFALEALATRRTENLGENHEERTASLPAGSPMFFGCKGCNAAIVVPECYLCKPSFCEECSALKELGWLE